MEVFLSIPKYFAVIGIYSPQSSRTFVTKNASNTKIYMVLLLFCSCVISAILFLIFDAKTIAECTNGFFIVAAFSVLSFNCFIYIWKRETTFEFLMDFEEIVQKSETLNSFKMNYDIKLEYFKGLKNDSSANIYFKSNRQVDKLIQIFKIAFTKVTVHIQMWLRFIMSYYSYFSTDSGNEAFNTTIFLW